VRRALCGRPGTWTACVTVWLAAAHPCAAGDFVAGADMSHLAFFESRGVVYRQAGEARDALGILKQEGLICVRLRLFTSSPAQAQADPYNYVNNLEYTLPLATCHNSAARASAFRCRSTPAHAAFTGYNPTKKTPEDGCSKRRGRLSVLPAALYKKSGGH